MSASPRNLIGSVVRARETVLVWDKSPILTLPRKNPEMTVPISLYDVIIMAYSQKKGESREKSTCRTVNVFYGNNYFGNKCLCSN